MKTQKPNFSHIMGNQLKNTREKIDGKGIDSLIPPSLQPESEDSKTIVNPDDMALLRRLIAEDKQIYKTKANEIKASILIKEDKNEKIKSYAYFNRLLIKDIIDEALEDWIKKVEDIEGPIKLLPKPKKRRQI